MSSILCYVLCSWVLKVRGTKCALVSSAQSIIHHLFMTLMQNLKNLGVVTTECH